MTTSVMNSRASSMPETATKGRGADRYSLVLSTDRDHRDAAQKLRYDVFASEPGYDIPRDPSGRDADRFDEFCDHLLVRDNTTDDFVGCYRMLTPDAAIAAGGYYTATEFDLTALNPAASSVVEMGRAVVRPEHRSGSVLGLMWAGILHYLEVTGLEWVMGCVSVPMQASAEDVPGANVRGVRDFLLDKHGSAPDRRVIPRNPVVVDGRGLDDIVAPARTSIPPLLRGYLRLNAVVCGEPSHDPDFGVADFVALLGLSDANTRYLDRLRSAANTYETRGQG
ncbi:phosphohistidine phosphatase [Rhodococcus sp. 14-2470-1b]|uniref:GNAT family N-acetyltransferase n=1 Tax=Rhodococcus sp. 14-2470-1b TaxID=2023149 RepID=UPI000B9BEA82|nr:GNAT family N-acyltransferase [Rhodococcus sp. 14-2470-1b]OZF42988.1 phosphohistidine phosphatase [Rhodococcus sp. 14-2470-1b]